MAARRRPPASEGGGVKVLRIMHHGVVAAWRERDRQLRAIGSEAVLLSAARWSEGGRVVDFEAGGDRFAHGVRTFGTHPNAFLYDPFPIWRALRQGPDVIDIHEEPLSLATAEVLLLRRLAGSRAPYVLYSAQNIRKRYPPPFRWIETYALRHAAGSHVCNVEAGRILEDKGLPVPASVVPLGVDVEEMSPSARERPRDRPVVGYVGRLLEPHKGVSDLIRASAVHPGWRVRLIGDGPQRRDLQALADSLGVADRVEFAGFSSGPGLVEAYRSLDVLVVPSVPNPSWTEQFGRVVVEAMACGIPVVASTAGALPEVVGDAGVLFPAGDPVALGDAVEAALEPARWSALRAAGLERAQQYTWTSVAAQLDGLYRRALAGRAVRRRDPEIVVVAYGAPDLLVGAVAALEGRFPLTIVDNSSSEHTHALAEGWGARYVDPGANLGFGAGVNVALAALAAAGLADRDVLLLNPDARIDSDGVHAMTELLGRRPEVAAAGAAQTDPATGEPVRVWWPFPSPRGAWLEALGLGRLNRAKDFAIGSVLLLRAEAIADVGGFDERFFLYAEETDWQRRARGRGWRIAVADVVATHVGAGTSPDETRREGHFYASAERYIRKHFGDRGWRSYRAAVIVGATVRARLLPGARGAAARRRRDLFARGPDSGTVPAA